MSPNRPLPQEWPNYLHDDAEVQPALTVPPPGTLVLDFTALQPVGFEQFCWWLLRKSYQLSGCKRLGGSGHDQGGIDLLAFDHGEPDKLIVFECKSGQGFSSTDLAKAIQKFNEGVWKSSTREFYLIIAKYEMDPLLAKRWKQVKEDLRRDGINAALWTAHTLTALVQRQPDVLSKFFPKYELEYFGNKWMQRVAFQEELSKALFDPRDHVQTWAKELAQQGELCASPPVAAKPIEPPSYELPLLLDNGAVRKFDRYGNNWSYTGPWFSVNAILPGPEFSHPSAAINFNIDNLAGLTLALSGRWLHDKMLFATGAPVVHQHRAFIIGPAVGLPGQVIDLSSARLRLPDEVVEELARVADELTADVQTAYSALESKWGARGLPFVTWAGNRVALGTISGLAWRQIMAFAQEHDVNAGEGPWYMFDAAPNVLKPYVTYPKRHGGRFATGYHGIFYASAEVDVGQSQDELAILWQPHDLNPNEELSERSWWTCEFAQRWLNEELLPEVRRWALQGRYPSWIDRLVRGKAMSRFESELEWYIALRDLRQLPLLDDGRLAVPTLEAVERLQSFFHGGNSRPHAYVDKAAVEGLYAALAMLARAGHGHVEYVASNLSLRDSPVNHAELEAAIRLQVREQRVFASSFVVDCALRAALELMGRSGALIPPPADDALRSALVPLARVHDAAQLARRHQPPAP
jgi:hypothetical protein